MWTLTSPLDTHPLEPPLMPPQPIGELRAETPIDLRSEHNPISVNSISVAIEVSSPPNLKPAVTY